MREIRLVVITTKDINTCKKLFSPYFNTNDKTLNEKSVLKI